MLTTSSSRDELEAATVVEPDLENGSLEEDRNVESASKATEVSQAEKAQVTAADEVLSLTPDEHPITWPIWKKASHLAN